MIVDLKCFKLAVYQKLQFSEHGYKSAPGRHFCGQYVTTFEVSGRMMKILRSPTRIHSVLKQFNFIFS
jgi:hypothetical protein